ncbi:DNA repair photolyase [Thermococcus stetteri]|nr:DNA repair photolyase [Thermococcus stetteri]
MGVRVIKRRAKSLYTRSRIPGVGWSVNQYVGCAFACSYCYAKFLTKWRDYGEWGRAGLRSRSTHPSSRGRG